MVDLVKSHLHATISINSFFKRRWPSTARREGGEIIKLQPPRLGVWGTRTECACLLQADNSQVSMASEGTTKRVTGQVLPALGPPPSCWVAVEDVFLWPLRDANEHSQDSKDCMGRVRGHRGALKNFWNGNPGFPKRRAAKHPGGELRKPVLLTYKGPERPALLPSGPAHGPCMISWSGLRHTDPF